MLHNLYCIDIGGLYFVLEVSAYYLLQIFEKIDYAKDCEIEFILYFFLHFFCRHIKNDQNIMLLNLCVALILSYVVFISAVEKADIEVGNRNLEYS